jgi:hypothetical protein
MWPETRKYLRRKEKFHLTFVTVTRIGENTSTKITGIAPATGYEKNKIEIRTQYTGSSVSFLKTPRAITSRFILSEA